MPQLIIKKGKVQIDKLPLKGNILTVGRGGNNSQERVDFHLPDRDRIVSRYHALLVNDTEGHYWVIDLSSANGTYVNGQMVYRQRLKNGDVIRVGDFRLIYDDTEPVLSGLPFLVLVDRDTMVGRTSTGLSTRLGDRPQSKYSKPGEHWQIVYNEIVSRMEHVENSGNPVEELIAMLVRSSGAQRGFIAAIQDKAVLIPVAVYGFDGPESSRFSVSQECVERSLQQQVTVFTELFSESVACCPLFKKAEQPVGVIYLQSQQDNGFEPDAMRILEEIGRWAQERADYLFVGKRHQDTGAPVGNHFIWKSDIVDSSNAIRELLLKADRLAESEMNVMLLGESGTGKEVFAKRIHRMSKRSEGPFVAIEVSKLQKEHADGDLFGWNKGSFSGSTGPRKGVFEQADGGTLFLDEIGDANMEVQAKLRRVVETKEFSRLGSEKMSKADVRIIAATNVDLDRAVEAGTFRGDLLNRFGATINISPLRNRSQEIPILFQFFIDQSGGSLMAISHGAMQLLNKYHWPNNARGPLNLVRQWNAAGKKIVYSWDLPDEVVQAAQSAQSDTGRVRTLKEIESDEIIKALENANWNITEAARQLGFKSKQTLYNKMKNYGIERP